MNLNTLKAQFAARFPEGGSPFICRIPGRVNLMGEHLDYNGLPVLPMAIKPSVYLAFSPTNGGTIRLSNVEAAIPEATFENGPAIAPSPMGDWENYAKAAITGLNQHYSVTTFPGMDVLVGSDLPHSAGLSSSSALVVGFAMAYLAALGYTLDQDLSRLELAALLANAEHYVGTAGGGMDQTAILLGEGGCATRINFIPFQVEPIPLPDGGTFLVCDSLVKASKTGEALRSYNAGPATCGLLTALIDRHLKESFGEEFSIDCLGDLWFGPLCFNHAEVKDLFDAVFSETYRQPEEIARVLGISADELAKYWLDYIPFGAEGLPLQARARHVLTEYYRVETGRDALLAGDLGTFGDCMNASHQSCAIDFGISTPELDGLCGLLTQAGCYGARLTGAGFGGSVVALAPAQGADEILDVVRRHYYDKIDGFSGPLPAFATSGGSGAEHIS